MVAIHCDHCRSKSVDDNVGAQSKIPKRSQLPTVQFKVAQAKVQIY